jgi:predicted transcriptional regulator
VLRSAKDFDDAASGIGVTALLRRANMSYARFLKLMRELVASGLIEEITAGRSNRYKISSRGLEFLEAYQRFEDFATDFGLRL